MEKPQFKKDQEKENIEKIDMPKTGTEWIDFEMDMIRYTLLLNPENQKLSPEELDKLVIQEFKDSR